MLKNIFGNRSLFLESIRFLSTPANQTLSIKDSILKKIEEKFGYKLFHAEVTNVSWKHEKPKDAETHFEIIVVTEDFEKLKNEKRHKIIKDLISDELKKLESVDVKLLTPSKWYDSNRRGLKLETVYSNPPVLNGNLENLAKKYAEAIKATESKISQSSSSQQQTSS